MLTQQRHELTHPGGMVRPSPARHHLAVDYRLAVDELSAGGLAPPAE
jgi:hypothetical protein